MHARAAVAAGALIMAGAALGRVPGMASAAAGSEYVSTSGTSTGHCTKRSPCKTINCAISRATSGETIHVEKGTYHQTVDVNKAVTILGAGAASTTINGVGIDPSSNNYYGVIYIGSAGGTVTVSGIQTRSVAIPPTPPGTDCGPYGTSNGGGGTLNVTTNANLIKVRRSSHSPGASDSPAASWGRNGGLHVPHFLGSPDAIMTWPPASPTNNNPTTH